MMTLLNEHAMVVLVGFPALMIGIQVFLFAFPSEAGEVELRPKWEV